MMLNGGLHLIVVGIDMGTRFKILRRLTGGAGPGAPSSIPVGELAYNEDGNEGVTTQFAADKDSLYIGNIIDASKILISNRRQVEVTGKQNYIQGRKSFNELCFGGLNGEGLDDIAFPLVRGGVGQYLKLNSDTSALEWANQANVTSKSYTVTVNTGDVWTDTCAMDYTLQSGSSFVTINNGDIVIFSHDGSAYIWVGPSAGTTVGQGGSHICVEADFTLLGEATEFALQDEVYDGTTPVKAISPLTGTTAYMLKGNKGVDLPQTVLNTITFNEDVTLDSANLQMANYSILGTNDSIRFNINYAQPVASVVGSIKGDGATLNQLDNLVFNAGTF